MAGCQYDYGRLGDKGTQPRSQLVILTGISINDKNDVVHPPAGCTPKKGWDAEIGETGIKLASELANVNIQYSYERISSFSISETLFMMMSDHEYNVSILDARDITVATIDARGDDNGVVDGLRSLGGK